jgi:hypothetical protein
MVRNSLFLGEYVERQGTETDGSVLLPCLKRMQLCPDLDSYARFITVVILLEKVSLPTRQMQPRAAGT